MSVIGPTRLVFKKKKRDSLSENIVSIFYVRFEVQVIRRLVVFFKVAQTSAYISASMTVVLFII